MFIHGIEPYLLTELGVSLVSFIFSTLYQNFWIHTCYDEPGYCSGRSHGLRTRRTTEESWFYFWQKHIGSGGQPASCSKGTELLFSMSKRRGLKLLF